MVFTVDWREATVDESALSLIALFTAVTLYHPLPAVAPARCGVPEDQGECLAHRGTAAVAPAFPHHLPVPVGDTADHLETAVSLSRQVPQQRSGHGHPTFFPRVPVALDRSTGVITPNEYVVVPSG